MTRLPVAYPIPADSVPCGERHANSDQGSDIRRAAFNLFALDNRPNCRRLGTYTDGLSNTILMGEKAINIQVGQSGSWYWDQLSLGRVGRHFAGRIRAPSRPAWHGRIAPLQGKLGLPHTGEVHLLSGDGDVRLIPRTIPTCTTASSPIIPLRPAGDPRRQNPFVRHRNRLVMHRSRTL
jgi:uncharacterized protein DUF1559